MRPLVGTSSKMHLTSSEARPYLEAVRRLLEPMAGVDAFVLPPFTSLWVARECLSGSRVAWGAQDVHPEDAGAHTGDVSAPMLVDLGCRYVVVGHAERRRDHGETDEIVSRKVAQALRHGLVPVLCVGERTRQGPAQAIAEVLAQVERGLSRADVVGSPSVVIAYEPVWAIGHGAASADPSHIGAIHAAIRERVGPLVRSGATVRVIHGGSVDAGNAGAVLATPAVDGLFVGRAALDPQALAAIAAVAQRHAERVGSAEAAPGPAAADARP
jgi:triosephosphate isomerase